MIPQFHEAIVSYLFLLLVVVTSMVGFFHRPFYYANVYQPSQVFAGKRVWTVVTSAFVHGGWPHLLFNVLLGITFIPEVEYILVDDFGQLAAGVCLSLLFVGIVSITNFIAGYRFRKQPDRSAVGLSGFGFAMAVFYYIYFPLDSSPNLPMLRAFHFAAAVPIVCVLATIFDMPGNNSVHLAGCLMGALAAFLVRPEIITELLTHFRTDTNGL